MVTSREYNTVMRIYRQYLLGVKRKYGSCRGLGHYHLLLATYRGAKHIVILRKTGWDSWPWWKRAMRRTYWLPQWSWRQTLRYWLVNRSVLGRYVSLMLWRRRL